MGVSAQKVEVGVALQGSTKIGEGGTFDHTNYTWYRERFAEFSGQVMQDQRTFPPELGGPVIPDAAYKARVMFGGTMSLIPRLKQVTQTILEAGFGNATTATGVDLDGNSVSGVYKHTFTHAADPTYIPFITVRCNIPNASVGDDAILAYDCKIAGMRFVLAASELMQIQAQFQGRDQDFPASTGTWVYGNNLNDGTSSPHSANGFVKLGGTEYPIVGLTIEVGNTLSNEFIVGSYRPHDYTTIWRPINIRFVYQYEDRQLGRLALTNSTSGTTWSPLPAEFVTGGSPAFEARVMSAKDIVAGTPYAINFIANRVAIQPGRVFMAPGDIIRQEFVATVLAPSSGDYFQVNVLNDIA